ncbi:Calcium-dependent protein kinase 4-like protein [Drosera capensis]
MGNTCRRSSGIKFFQGYSQPEVNWNSVVISNQSNKNTSEKSNSDNSPTSLKSQQLVSEDLVRDSSKKEAKLPLLSPMAKDGGTRQFGTTYLCTEIATGVDYACKSITKRKLIAKKDVEDVRREIQIMHHLAGHKNIVTIKGAYEDSLYLLVNKADDFSLKAIDFGLSVFFKPGQFFTDVVGSLYYVAPEVLLKHYRPEADVWTAGVILYILLSGVPPFWAGNKLPLSVNFYSDPASFAFSFSFLFAIDFLSFPGLRNTAGNIRCGHPWICENGVAPDRALDLAILSRLKNFSVMNKLKKMALRVIAESLSEEEITGSREMFTVMDTDNSGAITFEELKAGLRSYGSTLKDTEIRDLMDAADVDNSGTTDYGEFIAATIYLNKPRCSLPIL